MMAYLMAYFMIGVTGNSQISFNTWAGLQKAQQKIKMTLL